MGSGSDTAKDTHLQWCFWKQAYPQQHTSAPWCRFPALSACHRCNLQCLTIVCEPMQREALSLSLLLLFCICFQAVCDTQGIENEFWNIIQHQENLDTAKERWLFPSLYLRPPWSVEMCAFFLCWLTWYFFISQIEHTWRHLLLDTLLCVLLREDQYWVASLQRTILQPPFLEFVGSQLPRGTQSSWSSALWNTGEVP